MISNMIKLEQNESQFPPVLYTTCKFEQTSATEFICTIDIPSEISGNNVDLCNLPYEFVVTPKKGSALNTSSPIAMFSSMSGNYMEIRYCDDYLNIGNEDISSEDGFFTSGNQVVCNFYIQEEFYFQFADEYEVIMYLYA